MPKRADQRCPCGRPLPYAECCGPAHRGAAPATAEALMRFVRRDGVWVYRAPV
jgi:SEC-C motif domain protein